MKYPIVIGTHLGSRFLQNCLESLRGMPCIVIVNDGFEMGKIREAFNSMSFDRFMFVPDSVEFKRTDWIGPLFDDIAEKSVSLCQCPCRFGSYMGIYRQDVLAQIDLPETTTKVRAVEVEREFSDAYCRIERPIEMFHDLSDCDRFEKVFGRMNMILENAFIKKFKGTWNMALAQEIDSK